MTGRFDPATTALLLVDLQNDFLHPNGAYGRAGQTSAAIAELPARLKPVAAAMRKAGGWIVSTHFTLVPGKGGEPMISPHLKKLRPFLAQGRFRAGRVRPRPHRRAQAGRPRGREGRLLGLLHEPARIRAAQGRASRRWSFAGIVTNGGVASTVRDAHVRDFTTVLLSDGCAAFDARVHDATVVRAVVGRRPS